MSDGFITTEEILRNKVVETGLSRPQLLRMVAKSAAIRHLASHPEQGESFVLKGGTLLTNVYKSPRQSIADIDLTHREPDAAGAVWDVLDDALTIDDEDGFILKGDKATHVEPGDDIIKSIIEFSIKVKGSKRNNRAKRKDRILSVTVALKRGEWLDPCDKLDYTDELLATDQTFKVQGLTINELSAEKVLGWCSKGLPKHLTDLAYIARDQSFFVDHERVADLINQKFETERHAKRYRDLGIRRLSDLAIAFNAAAKTPDADILWNEFQSGGLLIDLSTGEKTRADSITNRNVIWDLASAFWRPTLDLLQER